MSRSGTVCNCWLFTQIVSLICGMMNVRCETNGDSDKGQEYSELVTPFEQ